MFIQRITKSKNVIKIEYQMALASKDDDQELIVLKSKETPSPALLQAMADCCAVFFKQAEIKASENALYRTFSFKYYPDEPNVLKECSLVATDAPLGVLGYDIAFNPLTNIKLADNPELEDSKFYYLLQEAISFVEGERAEGKLM